MKNSFKLLGSLLLSAALVLTAAHAFATTAGTAANTQIINTATLSSNGIVIASSSVIVTVALVPAQPNVSIGRGSQTYQGPNSPAIIDSVTITSNANGPASYTLAPTVSGFSNTNGASVSVGSTVVLGATISTGTSSTTSITVPTFPFIIDPTNNSATQINGIAVNDTIIFTVGGTTYTRQVSAINNPGTQGGTASISFDGAALPIAPGAGTPVYEQQSVNLNVLPGTVVASGTPIKVDVQAVISTGGVANVTVDTSTPGGTLATPNVWNTPSPTISITKYVRNLTPAGNPVAGGTPTNFSINGSSANYYRSGVTANKNDVLEYVIVASNTATTAAGDLNNCALSDLIPIAFASFTPNLYGAVGKDIWYINELGVGATLTAGTTGQASYNALANPNLVVNVGTGADATHTGTLPHLGTVSIAYQVTVK
jgi:hypothetical protein